MKIGIPVWKVGENSLGSTVSYVEYAERFGEVVLLSPEHEPKLDLDLLILPGGADVDPARYKQKPNWYTGKPDLIKEYFDRKYLPIYVANRVPILGIN